jgi:hypothetical protein
VEKGADQYRKCRYLGISYIINHARGFYPSPASRVAYDAMRITIGRGARADRIDLSHIWSGDLDHILVICDGGPIHVERLGLGLGVHKGTRILNSQPAVQWGIRHQASPPKARQSTLDFLPRMGFTPAPVTGTSKLLGSSSSNVGLPHSTDRSRITQTTGTMSTSWLLVNFRRASRITTTPPTTTERHLDATRPPASNRQNPASARSQSSVPQKQAYTAAQWNAQSASWFAPALCCFLAKSYLSSG